MAVIDEITVEAVPADEEEGQPDIKRKKLEVLRKFIKPEQLPNGILYCITVDPHTRLQFNTVSPT